jgi:hypothetical protein
VRMKKVSSAPSYEPESAEDTKDEQKTYHSGSEHWSEAIEKHIPMTLRHTSPMVCRTFFLLEQFTFMICVIFRRY